MYTLARAPRYKTCGHVRYAAGLGRRRVRFSVFVRHGRNNDPWADHDGCSSSPTAIHTVHYVIFLDYRRSLLLAMGSKTNVAQ